MDPQVISCVTQSLIARWWWWWWWPWPFKSFKMFFIHFVPDFVKLYTFLQKKFLYSLYFCLSRWSVCQIRRSLCHKFSPWLCWETGNATSLIPTNHRSHPCISSGRKKIRMIPTCWTFCQDVARRPLDCVASWSVCRSRHLYSGPTREIFQTMPKSC